ncbi:MAG TPA: hypothetical protein VF713_18155, partial [Thermoanaerobaculia bacterium]
MRDWPGSAGPRRESEPPARLTVDSRTSERQSYLFVTKLNADGTAGWTFNGEIPGKVVSTATRFLVTGSNGNYDSDM